MVINPAVCEGCGDCGVQSNCLSILPLETELGRKRQIEQSSCNKDYSCVEGFCPSFVSVLGGELKKPAAAKLALADLERALAAYPAPRACAGKPFEMLVAGVGGTGVVTIGALITMAAHLEGKGASTLDFMGFAQKGGAVMSHVRVASSPERLNQVRIDLRRPTRCSPATWWWRPCRTPGRHAPWPHGRVVANEREIPTAEFTRNPDARSINKAGTAGASCRRGRGRRPCVRHRRAGSDGPRAAGRSYRRQYPADGLRMAAGPGAGRPDGADARDRAEQCRGRHEQARLHAGRLAAADSRGAGTPAAPRGAK
jgi:hypothetical protein